MSTGEIIKELQRIYERFGRASERFRLHRNKEELRAELIRIFHEIEEILQELEMEIFLGSEAL